MTSVNQLNRNIENVALVGSGFQQVNSLWKQFENAMSPQPIVRYTLVRVLLPYMHEHNHIDAFQLNLFGQVPNQQEEGEEKTTVFLPQRTNTVGEDVEVLVPGAAPGAGAPGIELNPNTKPQ